MPRWLPLVVALLVSLPSGPPAGPATAAKPPAADPWRGPYPDDPDLPEGFSDTLVAPGITGATALAVAPDGRLFICEQTGSLRVVKGDRLLAEPFVTVAVDSYWERGLIGVTFDPDFPRRPYVYVCYVSPKPYPHHVVSRFTAQGDRAVPGSEVVLLVGDDQRQLGGAQPAGHQGGAVHFGKDGKLYVAIGEQTAGEPAQRMDTFQGKLLRINPDGSIPEDNPFSKTAKGKYRAIWALGLRNPFAFAVQPGTGRLFINDVGNARIEEVNEGAAGANYGWPESEGPTTNPKHRGPIFAYAHNVGRSITGGTFYNPLVRQFPAKYVGKYFFLDFMDHWMRVLDPDHPEAAEVFATGLAGPVDVVTAPDGSLYYLNRKEWVKDEKFQKQTGALHKITYPAAGGKAPRLTKQPAAPPVADGQPAVFSLKAEGEAPLRYLWLRNGRPIPGAESAAYELGKATSADDGAEFRCVVSNAAGRTRSRKVRLRVLPWHEAARTPPLKDGLEYRYYEGRGSGMPDFEGLRPLATGVTKAPTIIDLDPDERRAAVLEGFFDAPSDDVYLFGLRGRGLSKLFLGGTEVVSTPGGPRERAVGGSIALKKGKHPLRFLFTPGPAEKPGMVADVFPEGSVYHTDPRAVTEPLIAPGGGEHNGPVTVRLTAASPGATIRLTLDGCEPTRTSREYVGPFLLPRSAKVTARAFRGDASSPAVSAAFTISGDRRYGLPWRDIVTTLNVPADPADLPPLLSQTGVFRSPADLTPSRGLVPYDVNAPLWSDGAAKRRWIALPGDARIGFAPTGEWTFPVGTVFVKHFEIGGRRLETRLLRVDETGNGYGVTYRWRGDGQDAELLADGLTEEVSVPTAAGSKAVKWSYPSRNDCLSCHTAVAGFVLGVKTRQLNGPFPYPATGVTDNQLRTWGHLGMFRAPPREGDIGRLDRLVAAGDRAAPPERRVRSYLDANCAHCHRPGGARGLFDARYDTPLAGQGLVNGEVAAADLGVRDPKVVCPGSLERSMVYERMNRRRDVFNMPPLGTNQVDQAAAAVVAAWINELGRKQPPGRR
jgi:uncharacterized repeat protein (TIGR03806 family)